MNYIILLIFSTIKFNLLVNKAEALLPEQILGGDVAPEGKFNYQVSVQGNGVHECGGAILDDMFIATVAHCIINETAARFYNKHYKVVATRNVLYQNETIASADVEKVYFLKKFHILTYSNKNVFEQDEEFIILKLKEGFGLATNPLLKKLKLYERFSLRLSNTYVIAGHGIHALLNYRGFSPTDGKLRYADADIVSNDECGAWNNVIIKSYHLCARISQIPRMRRGTCAGDSGSPLVKNNNIIIGLLVSGNDLCSEKVFPSIYMKISYYSVFIENAKRGDTFGIRIFSLIKHASSGYTFIEDE